MHMYVCVYVCGSIYRKSDDELKELHEEKTPLPIPSPESKKEKKNGEDSSNSSLELSAILSELRYRAMGVVESLLSSSQLGSLSPQLIDKAVRLLLENAVMNNTRRSKLPSADVEDTMLQALLLQDRLWEIENLMLPCFVQTPLAPMQILHEKDMDDMMTTEKAAQKIWVHSRPLYQYDKIDTGDNKNNLLRYYDKHILPRLQDHLKKYFQPFEIADYTMQFRKPLQSGDEMTPFQVAWVLCNKRVPDGVTFPDTDRDWTTLTVDDIQPGQHVYVTPYALTSPMIHTPYMEKFVGQVGRVRSTDKDAECVLVQFYDESESNTNAYWFESRVLRSARPFYYMSKFSGWLERYLSRTECLQALIEMQEKAVLLALQRGLFTLCCQPENPLPRLKRMFLELQQKDYDGVEGKRPGNEDAVPSVSTAAISRDPIDFVLSALKQAIRLRELDMLGEPLSESEEHIEQLNHNLQEYAQKEGLSEIDLMTKWMQKLDYRLNVAATFYRKNVLFRHSRECDSKLRGYSKAVSVSGACALVIVFSKESELPTSQYSS
ncbi:hypothetical protein RFI_06024 [Reticulomyxa filosa]|uniref:Uncharacterized protein n=1 Tax=Reticulomyxa filosa TaxID=46433 RepID=X6NYM2_RETFI|nr:hypothetical protein RFI_06024 [Reticulomyxa filosa]|eukprot:ETO31096.1 hypothetical protein RFI_06024 [Reticulomyxa filosa]